MKKEFQVKDVVEKRRSIRSYDKRTLSSDTLRELNEYFKEVKSPFQGEVKFQILETNTDENNGKLGTYGVIKGASAYIGATVKKGDMDLESLGYEFEKVILFLAANGIGSCWLGGTFNRSQFVGALEIREDEWFPAISPIGYAVPKKRLMDTMFRTIAGSDHRKAWNELFFQTDFSKELTKEEAGEFQEVLEIVRLAPSASNKQPWRIVKTQTGFHFFEAKEPGYSDRLTIDIQRVDLGIAACHFHMAVQEKNINGDFSVLESPIQNTPENIFYLFSFVTK